jgi:polyribonucleotide nucleotidyltransferase
LHPGPCNRKVKMEAKKYSVQIAGKEILIESGDLAQQASGAVTVRAGDTIVLATAVVAPEPRPDIDFFPLLVDYEERLYAAGRISSSRFIKREGRPSDEAILTSRLVDRSIRPLFPKGYRNDVQIVITLLSYDGENDPDVLAIIGASSALSISNAPFEGPISAVRVGRIDGKFVANPTKSQMVESDLDLVAACTQDKIMMIEAGGREVAEDEFLKALAFAQEVCKPLIDLQNKMQAEVGKPKTEFILETDKEVFTKVKEFLGKKLTEVVLEPQKQLRAEKEELLRIQLLENFAEEHGDVAVRSAFEQALVEEARRSILEDNKRPDGRGPEDLRPLRAMVSVLPRTHGSALFQRGETQDLTVATLGAPSAEQVIEGVTGEYKKRFMHHYNFPPFSTGEVRPMRSIGRREVGHGALVERALAPMVPGEGFPYTIRLVSEILSSNGSSSMAATCGSTLALMDAGVPIKAPVAGIAIGLISAEDGKSYKILTDIAGVEDGAGDMDFKMAGTEKGMTAVQMDIKIKGVSLEILTEATRQAKRARTKILEVMKSALAEPRKELSPYAPRVVQLHINPEKIRDVIGPGGKTVNAIIAATGVEIDIEEDGTVNITSASKEGIDKAVEKVKALTHEVKVGETFVGKVTRLVDFGAFVEILPGQEGLVHISQLAPYRVAKVTDVVKVGDVIPVKVIEIDTQGRINLSLKAAKEEKE